MSECVRESEAGRHGQRAEDGRLDREPNVWRCRRERYPRHMVLPGVTDVEWVGRTTSRDLRACARAIHYPHARRCRTGVECGGGATKVSRILTKRRRKARGYASTPMFKSSSCPPRSRRRRDPTSAFRACGRAPPTVPRPSHFRPRPRAAGGDRYERRRSSVARGSGVHSSPAWGACHTGPRGRGSRRAGRRRPESGPLPAVLSSRAALHRPAPSRNGRTPRLSGRKDRA